jgi:hypothetical protein
MGRFAEACKEIAHNEKIFICTGPVLFTVDPRKAPSFRAWT